MVNENWRWYKWASSLYEENLWEREREEGGDSQLLRAEDDFFFFLIIPWFGKGGSISNFCLRKKKERKSHLWVCARWSVVRALRWRRGASGYCCELPFAVQDFSRSWGTTFKKKTAILESKLFATNRKARGRRNRTKGAERGEVTWPKRHVWHV